ncbi:RecX family transcriptional regulator [Candidatus Saccharibacteria bacterium]|nr:RecX family transcriptional regulator [Candidatus Saccharibacteria bacterium]
MEIFNLRDPLLASPKGKRSHVDSPQNIAPPQNVITALKPGVHNQNRVNVFLDDKFAFSLDLAQIVEFKLKIGQSLSPPELAKLKSASEFGKLYVRTLEWVFMRPRSIRETRDHLRLKRFQKSYTYSDEDIEAVIEKLQQKSYLDDKKFAIWYIDNRNLKKGISRRQLELELSQKGIDRSLIDDLLAASGRSDAIEIKKIISKKARKLPEEKLLRYLVSKGFPYDLSKSLLIEFRDGTL